jgi:Leucine-rich repeat (LRR) protein
MDPNGQQPVVPTPEQLATCQAWWKTLSNPWKIAFNQVALRRTSQEILDDQTLFNIYYSEAHRFAGPLAPYPNMDFELTDLSGITQLPNAKIVVVTFHQIPNLKEIAHMKQIQSLFVFNNHMTSLEGVEGLTELQELYFNVNQVDTLKPLANLTKLHTIYCNYNKITSLEGVGKQHIGTLKQFVCLPNDFLPDSEVIRMEREIGIRCVKG